VEWGAFGGSLQRGDPQPRQRAPSGQDDGERGRRERQRRGEEARGPDAADRAGEPEDDETRQYRQEGESREPAVGPVVHPCPGSGGSNVGVRVSPGEVDPVERSRPRIGLADRAGRARPLADPPQRADQHCPQEDGAAGVDPVAEEVAFRLDRLESEDYRAWIAVDGGRTDGPIAAVGADLAGFVTTGVESSPTVFDTPDRLVVGDLYAREPYRGTGLAADLLDRAARRARTAGCAELALDVDVGNDRALAFYEKCGFETVRRRMSVPVEALEL